MTEILLLDLLSTAPPTGPVDVHTEQGVIRTTWEHIQAHTTSGPDCDDCEARLKPWGPLVKDPIMHGEG